MRLAYTVERLSRPDEIRELLAPDRAYAAYALAQVEPLPPGVAAWYLAAGPTGSALVMHSRSAVGHALFATGAAEALDAALSLHPGARFSFGSFRLEHRPIVEKYFLLTRRQAMLRMSVTGDTFRLVSGPAVRLLGPDVPVINRLYSTEGVPSAYRPEHVEEGVYYGVHLDGMLVSIAGTHAVSHAEGVAVVGNVFTHPHYRGRGLATLATSAVTAHLLDECDLVVLTVEEGNTPAVRTYARLGYETSCKLHESPMIRREPVGALSFARRLIAGWRGRDQEREVVLR